MVLLEIGVWRPVHAVPGLALNSLRMPGISEARAELLRKGPASILAAEAGDWFAHIVRFYLESEAQESRTIRRMREIKLWTVWRKSWFEDIVPDTAHWC